MLVERLSFRTDEVAPADFRTLIAERLRELGKSKYWLVQQLNGDPSSNSLYSYMRGESDLGTQKLAKILDVLGIDLVPRGEDRKTDRGGGRQK